MAWGEGVLLLNFRCSYFVIGWSCSLRCWSCSLLCQSCKLRCQSCKLRCQYCVLLCQLLSHKWGKLYGLTKGVLQGR